ncbi:transglycosylase SLT domain-containing protein [Escherichia coli]|uniref:transglycosylase SLT domain-containing protein n=1 Tax=Citrobacter farmeri TaxID=67824 RepID=UPI00198329D1|nr:transglycosylase SLT domain-containing protein [Salmonella enterica subsp. enterica serovar Montevideo]EIH4353602.1 transglycosylase SLT domain-containing protein [Escherichia coli]EJC8567481.1 transglycosylase SLT domain-containing protein [Salmonella enterica]EGJ4800917.1 transglycosylase SLT domain-containing protein [Salmonella enterica subsp. enterica serovar Montevideo]EGJ4869671.1 transglycosylase SLT domain-containing protein [Salmonella enterica subsp. enterica serovar Montevideo]
MAIKIPVSAQFDAADLQQQIKMVNDQIRILASQVGQANKQKWEPINLKSKDDLQGFIKQMDLLMKKQTEFAQRMKQTGQTGNPLFANFKKMADGRLGEQIKLMESVLGWAGVEFSNMPPPKPPRQPKHPVVVPPEPSEPAWRREMGRQGMNGLHSILGNAGPIGGTLSSALSTGMSSGAGAGMMGLVGGLAALGVGKIVGAIADKIGQAQDSAIGLDKLYRQVGGVVSYARLGRGVGDVANTLGMSHAEAIGMASTYARSSNLQPGMNLGTGLLVSGGLARGYGLDPNSVAASFGSLGATGITSNEQSIRKTGLMMGEAIAKSGAFAQAGDAIQAITDFANNQARMSLSQPNIAGYGGALAGLMSSGVPGMDLQGAGSLLNRMNGAVMHGGNMGEASQAFSARLGLRRGINDPMALQALQEGGAFSTVSSMLGKGSLYNQTTGKSFSGNETMLDMIRHDIHRQYGYGSNATKALANHLGIGVNEAMLVDQMSSRDINGASSRLKRLGIDEKSINMSSLPVLGQIESGKGLEALGNQYLKRSDLSKEERRGLIDALKGANPEKLKDALAEVASKHGGTTTEGSQIRDNIAKLNNTLEDYSKRALPALDMMRMALVNMTGGSEASVRKQYYDSNMREASSEIGAKYKDRRAAIQSQIDALTAKGVGLQSSGPDREKLVKLKAEMQSLNDQEGADRTRAAERIKLQTYGASSSTEAALSTGDGYIQSPAAAAANGGGGKYRLNSDMKKRLERLRPYFEEAGRKYNIDPRRLEAIAATESGFNNNLTSSKRAQGIMQVLPTSAPGANLSDERENIMAGAMVYSQMRDRYGYLGQDEILRGYNGGSRRGSAENVAYPGKVNSYYRDLAQVDDMTPGSNGNKGAVGEMYGTMRVVHEDKEGKQVKPPESVSMSGTFIQPSSWGNR